MTGSVRFVDLISNVDLHLSRGGGGYVAHKFLPLNHFILRI